MKLRTRPWLLITSLLVLLACALGSAIDTAVAEDEPAAPPKIKAKRNDKGEITRRPMLWMIEGTPRVFLYGTIHLADKRVTKHLPVVQAALDQSTALYTELRMDAQGMQEMQMAVMARAPMTDGSTLTKLFGADLHAKVAKMMPPQIPFMMLEQCKPWLIQILLIQTMIQEHQKKVNRLAAERLEEGEDGGPGKALDPLLYQTAQKAGKQVGGLESIDTQLDVFDGMSIETQVKMVKELVTEIEKLRKANAKATESDSDAKPGEKKDEDETGDELSRMIDIWLAGDDAAFLKIFEEEVRKQGANEEKFVTAMLDDRNVGMVIRILNLMITSPKQTFFIAVGAGHMPGKKGIVQLLQRGGFKVRRLELGDKIPALPGQPAKKDAPKKEPAGVGK